MKQFIATFPNTTHVGLVPDLFGLQPIVDDIYDYEISFNTSLLYPPHLGRPFHETGSIVYSYDGPYTYSHPQMTVMDNTHSYASCSSPLSPYSDYSSSSLSPQLSSNVLKSFDCVRLGSRDTNEYHAQVSSHEYLHPTPLDTQIVKESESSDTTATPLKMKSRKVLMARKSPILQRNCQIKKSTRRKRKPKEPVLDPMPMSEKARMLHDMNMRKVPWAAIQEKLNLGKEVSALQMWCGRERVKNHRWTREQVCYPTRVLDTYVC